MIHLKSILITTICLVLALNFSVAQNGIKIEGYTFETGNRGYLSQVDIQIIDIESDQVLSSITSDVNGKFLADLPPVSKSFDKVHERDVQI